MNVYYPIKNLLLIKTKAPETYRHLERLANQAHDLETRAAYNSAPFDIRLASDLNDLSDELTTAYKDLKRIFLRITGKPFFFHISDYKTRWCKLQIALAMYEHMQIL
jgi:hypothetical protein